MKFKTEKTDRSGLFLYLFAEKNFKEPFLFGPTRIDQLACDINIVKELGLTKTVVKSAKLVGYIKPKHTGDYKIKLSQNFANCQINLDDQCVVRNTDIKAKNLSVDEWVPIEISLQFDAAITPQNFKDLKLVMVDADSSEIELSQTDLLNPDFRNDRRKWLTASEDEDEDIDTDDDAIPDVFETNGYTIISKVAAKWDENYEGTGRTKFLSNPYLAHTVGDPYTDYEKAAKDIDRSSDPNAFNPLVAACPSVKVTLEKTILSPNKDYSRSVGSSSSTNYSATKSESLDLNTGLSVKSGLSFGLSKNWGKSETTGQEWGQSEDNSEHFNSASAAYLNANVRYRNTGTGSIYKLAPTTNFVIDDDTIATLKAKENTLAEGLASGDNYPDGGHGIALNTMDDFSSHPITLNKEQFEYFMSNKGPLFLETIQSAGEFIITDRYGAPQYGGEWTPYKKALEKTAANIIIDSGTDVSERYIAAKDFNDPEDLTPVLTVREALKLAFKNRVTEEDGLLHYDDRLIEGPQSLNIIDGYTKKEVERQINATSGPFKDVATIYDVKLFPKMALDIKIGIFFEEAYITNSFYHTTTHGDIVVGRQVPDLGWDNTDCFISSDAGFLRYVLNPKNKKLTQAGNYILSFYMKVDAPDNVEVSIGITQSKGSYESERFLLSYDFPDITPQMGWLKVTTEPFSIDQDYTFASILIVETNLRFNYITMFKL